MELKIKSNRKFMVKLFLTFDILGAVLLVVALVAYIIQKNESPTDASNYLWVVIMFLVYVTLLTTALIVIRLYKGKSYIFKKDELQVFNKGVPIYTIYLKDIKQAYYQSFKAKYIITIFFGDLVSGGAWKLHIELQNGERKELGFFDKNDIAKIKKIYGDLIQIK